MFAVEIYASKFLRHTFRFVERILKNGLFFVLC